MEGVARRPPRSPATSASASWSTSTTTTTSRSTARPRSPSRPRTTARASRPTAGTSSASRTSKDLDALRAAYAAARDEAERPSPDRRPLAHRLPGAARGRHRQGARQPARRGRGARDQGGDGLRPRRALLGPRRRLRAHEPEGARRRARGRVAASASTRGARRSPTLAPTGTWCTRAGRAPGWSEALPTFEAGEEIATRDAGKKVDAGVQAVRADDDRRRRRPGRVDQDRVRGRRRVLGHARRAQHPLRHPRARHGRDRQRRSRARRHRQAVRLDLPRLLRLHAARRAPVGADGRCRSSGCGRTTRSASARTARRTSRSSTTPRCARSRTCG